MKLFTLLVPIFISLTVRSSTYAERTADVDKVLLQVVSRGGPTSDPSSFQFFGDIDFRKGTFERYFDPETKSLKYNNSKTKVFNKVCKTDKSFKCTLFSKVEAINNSEIKSNYHWDFFRVSPSDPSQNSVIKCVYHDRIDGKNTFECYYYNKYCNVNVDTNTNVKDPTKALNFEAAKTDFSATVEFSKNQDVLSSQKTIGDISYFDADPIPKIYRFNINNEDLFSSSVTSSDCRDLTNRLFSNEATYQGVIESDKKQEKLPPLPTRPKNKSVKAKI